MANSQWTELANQYGEYFAVPPVLILSLIDLESGGDPNKVNNASQATGLMQITRVVLKDYNQRHRTSLSLEDIKNPETNIKIGAELLKRISMTYEKYNKLKPAWDNRAYIGLVVQGWNAGYSRRSGVSYVLSKMEAQGISRSRWGPKIVYEMAKRLPEAVRFLKDPRRLAWLGKVVDRYSGIEKNANKRVAQSDKKSWAPGTRALVYIGAGAGVLGLGYMLLSKESEPSSSGQGLLSGSGGAAPVIIINRK